MSAPHLDGVTLVRDTTTDAAYVSSEAVPSAVARAAVEQLRADGWTATAARNELDAPGLEWLYVGWAGEPEPS